jgi:hypothetical protein
MKMISLQKRPISFLHSITTFIILPLIILLYLPALSSSEEIYRFERMWPTLQQPTYLGGPCAVAVDNNGDIFVVDTINSRIMKFTSDGISSQNGEARVMATVWLTDQKPVFMTYVPFK